MKKRHPMKWLTRHAPSLVRDGRRRRRRSVHPARAQEPAAAVAGVEADAALIPPLVFDMEKAFEQIDDYTATLYKQERVKGHLLRQGDRQLKFRKPFGVYLRWVGGGLQTREVLYVRGWNDDKIRAHQGSFPDVTVNLRPDASLAMRGNRHPITEAGFGEVISLMVRDARLSACARRTASSTSTTASRSSTAPAAAASRPAPRAASSPYYAARAKICFNVKTKMPTQVSVWDAEDDLVEDYGFQDRLNVGLADADFDPTNQRVQLLIERFSRRRLGLRLSYAPCTDNQGRTNSAPL